MYYLSFYVLIVDDWRGVVPGVAKLSFFDLYDFFHHAFKLKILYRCSRKYYRGIYHVWKVSGNDRGPSTKLCANADADSCHAFNVFLEFTKEYCVLESNLDETVFSIVGYLLSGVRFFYRNYQI